MLTSVLDGRLVKHSLQLLPMILLNVCAQYTSVKLESTATPKEYCEFQTFRPQCHSSEVIVMKHALYGRMHLGECVESDAGHLGCKADVLSIADRKCSGRATCEINVPDPDFDKTKPCWKELKNYLEASYSCYRIAAPDQSCTVAVDSFPIHFHHQKSAVCGTQSKPLIVEASPGQTISVSLTDFNSGVKYVQGEKWKTESVKVDGKCRSYGFLVDRGSEAKNVTKVCGVADQREVFVHHSVAHSVEFVLDNQILARKDSNYSLEFLIGFKAHGCANLLPPKDAWLERKGDDVIIGCHATGQTWHLRCHGQQWTGVVGNCTQHMLAAKMSAQTQLQEQSLHVIVILTVVGIAFAICMLIVCVGVVCIRRYRCSLMQDKSAMASLKYFNVKTDDDFNSKISSDYASRHYYKTNKYSHVWEHPLPEPMNGCAAVYQSPLFTVMRQDSGNREHDDDTYNSIGRSVT